MATRTRGLIQDENLNVHYRGASIGREINVSKSKKAVGLGGRKVLTNITNSGKLSPHQASKKSHLKKLNEIVEEHCLHNHQDENLNVKYKGAFVGGRTNVSKVQKKAEVGGRRALTNISNSRKSSPCQASKKNLSKKLNDIAEEQCLHNHQECINLQTRGIDMQFTLRTLGFDDGFSMQFASPAILSVSRKAKPDFSSPPRYLEYEEIPELLNEDLSPPPGRRSPEYPILSPSPNCYRSPIMVLLRTP